MNMLVRTRDFLPPQDKEALQRFLGITGWYRRFIRNYALRASPLTDLLTQILTRHSWI